MPTLTYNKIGYNYGYNGKRLDKEGMGGSGATYDYGFRIYNPNIAKFLSVDPLAGSYAWYSSYHFAGNSPIWNLDLDGLEDVAYYYEVNDKGKTLLKTVTYNQVGPLGHGTLTVSHVEVNNQPDYTHSQFKASGENAATRSFDEWDYDVFLVDWAVAADRWFNSHNLGDAQKPVNTVTASVEATAKTPVGYIKAKVEIEEQGKSGSGATRFGSKGTIEGGMSLKDRSKQIASESSLTDVELKFGMYINFKTGNKSTFKLLSMASAASFGFYDVDYNQATGDLKVGIAVKYKMGKGGKKGEWKDGEISEQPEQDVKFKIETTVWEQNFHKIVNQNTQSSVESSTGTTQ